MDLLQHLPGCVLKAFQSFSTPEEIINAASYAQGNEKVIYPFFNIEILRILKNESLIGIGNGQIGMTKKDEIDCLLVYKNNERVGIEIKGGPSNKSYLLAGSTKKEIDIRFTSDGDKLKSDLKQCYDPAANNIYFDSQIGDIIKLANLVNEGCISLGYSLGLLSYTDQSINEKVLYREKLLSMCDLIKAQSSGLTFKFFSMDGTKYKTFITALEISRIYLL